MAKRVCPIWVGYLLINPLRTLIQNPEKVLGPYVAAGMKVLDIGCGMGFFSLPLARIVSSHGKVVCVDVQEQMIKTLKKRAEKSGLTDRIETRVCHRDSLDLDDFNKEIDFALAFAVIHEVSDVHRFFSDVYKVLKPTGKFLIAEPKGHVSKKDFEKTVSITQQSGFTVSKHPKVWRSRTVLLKKK